MVSEETRAPFGMYQLKVDDKGRLKMPYAFQRFMEPYRSWFATSLDGKTVRVYSTEAWKAVLAKLREKGDEGEELAFFAATFGHELEIDYQGRILSPIEWRKRLPPGPIPVRVYWNRDHILVLPEELYQKKMERLPELKIDELLDEGQ